MKRKPVIIDGKSVDVILVGDGAKQIRFFNKIAKYARTYKWTFHEETAPSKFPHMTDTFLIGHCEKYCIIAVESKIPDLCPPFSYPRYQTYVLNKETNEETTWYGAISPYYWNLLQEIKEKQK